MAKNKINIILSAIIIPIFVVVFFAVSFRTSADTIGGTPASSRLVPCGGPVGSDYADPCTLCHFIVGIHNLVQYGLFWVITFALVGIFISGAMYIFSSGDEGMITKAKSFMKASLIGFAVVAGAWMIVNTTLRVFSAKEAGDTEGTLGIGVVNWYTFICDTTTNRGVVPAAAPGSPGGCQYDSDCNAGQVCSPTAHICTTLGVPGGPDIGP